jgi:hypothetical protein
MDKFNVLPTDIRFINLFEEQKIALFEGLMKLPERLDLKKSIILNEKLVEIQNKKDEDFISPGMMKRMKATMKAMGKTEEEINKEIKKYTDSRRKVEMTKIEEARNE